MPPKSSRNATKAVPNDTYYDEQKLADDVSIFTLRLAALKNVYLSRMEEIAVCKQKLIMLKRSLQEKEDVLHNTENKRTDILTDCVRQNKIDEQDGIDEIVKLENCRDTLREEKMQLEKNFSEMESEYDEKIKTKRAEHEVLCQRLVDMEKEFTTMLAEVTA